MLRIKDDPLATLAERAMVARPMSGLELNLFLTAAARWKGPRLIAFKGYDPRPFHSLPVYYLDDAGNYVDTLTGELWEATTP